MAPSLIASENSSSINSDQPFHADGMGVMQIHHHRGDRLAERRSRLQTGRRRGGDPLAATGATAAEQAHLGHIRANRGQLDALIDLLQGLRRVRKHRFAFRAGGQPPVDRAIRVRMQRPTDTGAALARRAILHQVPGGLACVLARAASMNCRGSSAAGFGG